MKKIMVLAMMALVAGSVFAQKVTQWTAKGDVDNGGTSTAELTVGTVNIAGKSFDDVATVKGTVTTDYQYGYATLFTDGGDELAAALKSGQGVRLVVTGDGKSYDLRLETSDRADYAFHRFTFQAPKGKVATYDITYKKLKQYEWGQAKKFDPSTIKGVSIQTIGQPIPAYEFSVISLEVIK